MKIILEFLLYLCIGFFITILTSSPTGHKDEERFCFLIFLWPLSLGMRIIKLMMTLGRTIYIGFKEDFTNLFLRR